MEDNYFTGLPSQSAVKNLPAMWKLQETVFDPWGRKVPWRRAQQPTPVFMPGEYPWTVEPGKLQSIASQR